MNDVVFKKEWFNPLYFIIKQLLAKGVSEFYIYGGKDSAKTVTVSQIIGIDCLLKKRNALIFRKEGSLIKTTVKPSMALAIETARISNGWNTMDYFYRSIFGNEIIFKGLDKDEKAKGIEGFSYVLFDELNHFTYQEYDQSILSFRGDKAVAFFGTWNPVSEDSWVKTQLVDLDEWEDSGLSLPSKHSFVKVNKIGNRALIKTIYEDNFWCVGSPDGTYGYVDEKTLQKYERLRLYDPDMYSINVMGQWGVMKADNPFVRHLDYNTQVGSCKHFYKKGLPVYISLDFNEKFTALVKQIQGDKIYYFETLHDYPEDLLKDLAMKYGGSQVYFTGDFAGNSNNQYTQDSSKKTAWRLVNTLFNSNCCRIYRRSEHEQENLFANFDAVPRGGNISHSASRNVTNHLLYYWKDRVLFDKEGCRDLLSDCKRIEATNQGGLNKEELNRKNIGHWLDVLRYDNAYFHYEDYLKMGHHQ